LLSVISAEYQSNRYMQEWIEKNAWPIGYLLNGYLAATLIGFAIGGALLVLLRWRSSGETRIDRDRLLRGVNAILFFWFRFCTVVRLGSFATSSISSSARHSLTLPALFC